MVVLFVNENDLCYYRNYLYNHRYKFSSEKEQVNESQYIVSRPHSVHSFYFIFFPLSGQPNTLCVGLRAEYPV